MYTRCVCVCVCVCVCAIPMQGLVGYLSFGLSYPLTHTATQEECRGNEQGEEGGGRKDGRGGKQGRRVVGKGGMKGVSEEER